MATFTIEVEQKENPRVIIIRTFGYFDESGGIKFREIAQDFIAKGDKFYILNLQGSPIVNSIGISGILDITEQITIDLSGRAVFCGLSNAVAEAFKLVGITKLYPVFANETAALAQFSS
ncbi:MAG: STAS domain-containing protein [Candidatus Riflebacteria bacterium]|nr:STAS domain-containing protein [Candidatus Riflebacteria bacterium]